MSVLLVILGLVIGLALSPFFFLMMITLIMVVGSVIYEIVEAIVRAISSK
jgi:hypothetical protein